MKTKNSVQYYYNIAGYLHYSVYRPGGLASRPLRAVCRNGTVIGSYSTLRDAAASIRRDAAEQLQNIVRDKRIEANRLESLRFSIVVENKPKTLMRRT